MPLLKNKKPLLKCSRAHEIRGRIRLVCEGLRYIGSGDENRHLLEHFRTLDGVKAVRINVRAASVAINFDADKTTPDRIIAAVEEIIAAHSLGILQREREARNKLLVEERDLHEEPLSTLVTRSAVSAALLPLAFNAIDVIANDVQVDRLMSYPPCSCWCPSASPCGCCRKPGPSPGCGEPPPPC